MVVAHSEKIPSSPLFFKQIVLQGADIDSFLQGQVTVDVTKLGLSYRPTAICNLKGRIEFGIWIKKQDEKQFAIVISSDCLLGLQAHIKKYSVFSKVTAGDPIDIYPCVLGTGEDVEATFSHDSDQCNLSAWQSHSIAVGNYWLTQATQGMFQPQELRLHQRGGIDYDKGCYLGQEVIARLYFKAAPKAFLHRISGLGNVPAAGDNLDKIKVVNAIHSKDDLGFEALVVARPEQLKVGGLTLLSLPDALQADVARKP